ncbi:succinate dehydrogenase assembly factor 2 [Mangrovicoccus sp. HB161399]|uniref:FAD assembly factor SdhE n=1 Tax=Mangrovicoccus sp. HB161399 TaxID=2720392 RepID=UPI001553C6DC|nr:succinate dehydrogenase assembly factor 2 [Mangrovicoccus sp. HB161399]
METHENRLKRLHMRSIRRGIKEMDIILGRFAETGLRELPEEDLTLYDTMLAENDHDLYQWVSGQQPTPPRYLDLVSRIAELNRIAAEK